MIADESSLSLPCDRNLYDVVLPVLGEKIEIVPFHTECILTSA